MCPSRACLNPLRFLSRSFRVLGKNNEEVTLIDDDDDDDGYEKIVRDDPAYASDEDFATAGYGIEDENGEAIDPAVEELIDDLGFDDYEDEDEYPDSDR